MNSSQRSQSRNSEPEATQAIAPGKHKSIGFEAKPEDLTIVPPRSGTVPPLTHPIEELTPLVSDSIVPILQDKTESNGQPSSYHTLSGRNVKYPKIPGFEILGELGRGGMGVVYRVKQQKLNRIVALKMLLHADDADLSDVMRFRSEAEAVASIKHPNVVAVHEFGHHEGKPYFTMEYLAGGTLHQRIKQHAPFKINQAVELVEKIAKAIQAAHTQGIVHRDLKPGNVLFDVNGEPRITDFGLAKRIANDVTQTQAVMGTPAYMPPEQAAGKARLVGPPADIYACGVILYECVMGKPPFESSESLNLLQQVIHDNPPPMRSRRIKAPRDLELICMKCLEKEPGDRYKSAADLAEDLRRFRDREPVSIRPAGRLERTVKWAKRRPTLATAYGLGIMVAFLSMLVGGALLLWLSASRARDIAEVHRQDAESAKAALAVQKKNVEKANDDLARRNALLDKATKQAETALKGEKESNKKLETERETTRQLVYFRDVAAAQKELNDKNFLRAIQLLEQCPADLRGWEWWHVYRSAHPEIGSGITMTGIPTDVAFDPLTGVNIITAQLSGDIIRFDFSRKMGLPQVIHTEPLARMLLSADGKRAITIRQDRKADAIAVWDLQTGIKLCSWAGWNTPLFVCGFSGDGNRAVVGYYGQPLRTFDVASSSELKATGDRITQVSNCILGTDGETAAVALQNHVLLWDVTNGKSLKRIQTKTQQATVTALDPLNKVVVIGTASGDIQIHTWSDDKATPVTIAGSHMGSVQALAYSPDGTLIASAGEDGAVRIWETSTGKQRREYFGHTKAVNALRFNKTGEYVVSCDNAFMFRVWSVTQDKTTIREKGMPKEFGDGDYYTNNNCSKFFTTADQQMGRIWLPASNKQYPFPIPDDNSFTAVCLHPTAEEVLVGTEKGQIAYWGKLPSTGNTIYQVPSKVTKLEYSADGSRVMVACQRRLAVLDMKTQKPIFEQDIITESDCFVFSRDGKRIAMANGYYFTIFNVDEKTFVSNMLIDKVSALAFTPDSSKVLVGTRAWQVHYYDLKPGVPPLRTLTGHTSAIRSIGFNTEGTSIAAGAEDGSLVIWDTATGTLVVSLETSRKLPVNKVVFMPEYGWLAFQPGKKPITFEGMPGDLAIKPPQTEFKKN